MTMDILRTEPDVHVKTERRRKSAGREPKLATRPPAHRQPRHPEYLQVPTHARPHITHSATRTSWACISMFLLRRFSSVVPPFMQNIGLGLDARDRRNPVPLKMIRVMRRLLLTTVIARLGRFKQLGLPLVQAQHVHRTDAGVGRGSRVVNVKTSSCAHNSR